MKNKIIKLAQINCEANGTSLFLGKGKSVSYAPRIKVNGYFDSSKNKLAVATARKEWELILIHEMNHMIQWTENCKAWKEYQSIDSNIIDDAIQGKSVNDKKLKETALITLKMEHDCEQRSYKTLKFLKYPKKKLIEYTQKANAYCLFYLFVAKNKKWYIIGKEPYNIKKIWKHFPKTFDFDIEKTFEKLEYLYLQCIEK